MKPAIEKIRPSERWWTEPVQATQVRMLPQGIRSVAESIPRIVANVLSDNDLSELKSASRLMVFIVVLVLIAWIAQSCM